MISVSCDRLVCSSRRNAGSDRDALVVVTECWSSSWHGEMGPLSSSGSPDLSVDTP